MILKRFILALLLSASCAVATDVLPIYDRTNGVSTDDALDALREGVSQSTLRILDDQGLAVLTGTFVSTDGYFLTKASESPTGSALKVVLPDGSQRLARVAHRALDRDLLLGKVSAITSSPVTWLDNHVADVGDWVVSATSAVDENGDPMTVMRVGVISAARRSIPASRAALGLELSARGGQAVVSSVWPDSPAARAGIAEGDAVLTVEEQQIQGPEQMRELLTGYRAGQSIALGLSRGQKAMKVQIRLGSYSRVHLTAAGEDYANGGVSLRTDGYASILQHDMPLKTRDMGGPLMDLQGRCIALNISRVDRISTFALPGDSFADQVQQWMLQDAKLNPETVRKALPVTVSR
jgi:serine protease Do